MLFRRHSALLLFFVVLSLCGLGIVMLFSASAWSREALRFGDPSRFLRQQSIMLGTGLLVCGLMAATDYRRWGRHIFWVIGGAILLMSLCYVPGVGRTINGSTRWISLGGFSLQPSEFAKIALLLFLGFWYQQHQSRVKTFVWGFAIPALVVGMLMAPILIERITPSPGLRDLGSTLVLCVLVITVMVVVGVPWYYYTVAVLIGAMGLGFMIQKDPERMSRLLSHHSSAKKAGAAQASGDHYQQRQSLIALGSGGVYGHGMGESRQKLFFLPEAHTDFIFSIIGEELGLRVTLAVVFGFVLITLFGGFIALSASDVNGMVLALGATFLLALQAFINMGVVTDLLPNKGLPLPFVSYGGTALIASLGLVGLLVSVARGSSADSNEEERW